MPEYTTGEVAKLCGVSVRTVQYYDTRGVLSPSALSEGGRRLYSEDDLKKMKIVCFLRDAGLSIAGIGALMTEKDPESVITLMLAQQEKTLRDEIGERQEQLRRLEQIRRSMHYFEEFSMESVGDIANLAENRKALSRVRLRMLLTALPMGLLEWGSILLWIFSGVRWPFLLYTALAVPYTVGLFTYYYRNISYICPHCHRIFKPGRKEMFFAGHTAVTRKLTCTGCGRKSFCVETCGKENKEKENGRNS